MSLNFFAQNVRAVLLQKPGLKLYIYSLCTVGAVKVTNSTVAGHATIVFIARS
jgi:hypothetical protein